MKMIVVAFASALENIQQGTGLRLAARGGAYGSNRLVIVDAKGEEYDYNEALAASEGGHRNVPTNES